MLSAQIQPRIPTRSRRALHDKRVAEALRSVRRNLFSLETLETRVLLNASSIVAAVADATTGLSAGLSDFSTKLASAQAAPTNPVNSLVPGIVLEKNQLGSGGVNSPTMRNLLAADVDHNHDGTINLADFTELTLYGLDADSNHIVDGDEALRGLFTGPVQNFLQSYPGGNTLAQLQADFASFLSGLHEPATLTGIVDLSVNSVAPHGSGFGASFTVDLRFTNALQLDLGTLAESQRIELPQQIWNADGTSTDLTSLQQIPVTGELTIPLDVTFASSEFSFVVPSPITTSVDANEALSGLSVNIGFLGTSAKPSSAFQLHMQADTTVTDPSSPTRLGFADADPSPYLFSDTSASGVLTGTASPETDLSDAVQFSLKIGQHMLPQTVTVSAGNYSTASGVSGALQTALNGAGLGGVTTSGVNGSGFLTLSLPVFDFGKFGFSGNEAFDSGGTLDATGAPVDFDGGQFLLSTGGGIPKQVQVANGATDLAGLISNVQAALDAAFGAGNVTASQITIGSEDGIRLETTGALSGQSLEVSQTLAMSATTSITRSELDTEPIEKLFGSSASIGTDAFSIDLPLSVKAGINYTPSSPAELLITQEPFSITPADEATDSTGANRLKLPVTLTPANELLDFAVIGSQEVVALFGQLKNWLDGMQTNEMLAKYKVPFSTAVIGKLLDFGTILGHQVLYNDGGDGLGGTNADTSALLNRSTIDPNSLVAVFGTAQELVNRLNFIGLTSASAADYNTGTKALTYPISFSANLLSLEVPIDFHLDLSPLAKISSSSKVKLAATGHFDATVGFYLGNAALPIDDSTALSSLNSGAGVPIKQALALTGAFDVATVEGRLSANATFGVRINGAGSFVPVTVSAAATAANLTTDALVANLNTALGTAGIGTLIGAARDGSRIKLYAKDSSVNRFDVSVDSNNAAYKELGLQPGAAATVAVAFKPSNVALSSDTTLHFSFNGGASTGDATVSSGSTTGNVTITDLVNDINAALAGASLGSIVAATRSGDSIVVSAIDAARYSFDLTVSGDSSSLTGSAAYSGAARVFLTAERDVFSEFGRLSSDAHLSVTLGIAGGPDASASLAVLASATSNNQSVDALITEINTVIAGSSLSGKIAAEKFGSLGIRLTALDASVTSISVTTAASDAANTQLGFGTSQSEGGLASFAAKNAPAYTGPKEDAHFTLEYTDSSGNHSQAILLGKQDALDNQSIFDLVGDLNRALDAAFGGSANNPFLAGNDGSRLVITARTGKGVTAFDVTAAASDPAVQDLKLYDIAAFSDPASPPSSGSPVLNASAADLLVFTRDGSVYPVVLDTATTIGNVRTAIQSATASNVTVGFNASSTGLELTDHTSGSALFRVDSINGSLAAQKLGIFGADISSQSQTPDGVIDGTAVGTRSPAKRFFLQQVDSSTKIFRADATIDFEKGKASDPADIVATADFGFVGIQLTGDGSLTGSIGIGPADASAAVTLADMTDALVHDKDSDSDVDVFDLATVIAFPSFSLTGDLTLNVALQPDISAITLGGSPQLTLHVSDAGNPFHFTGSGPHDESDFTPQLPSVLVGGISSLGDLANFQSVQFNDLLSALEGVNDFLQQFSQFSFLSEKIPVIGLSFNDLVNIAQRFSKAVEEIQQDPAAALQDVEQKVREIFALPSSASVFHLQLTDNQDADADTHDLLKVSLDIAKEFSKALPVSLDLNNALPGLKLLGSAGFSAQGSLDAKLAFGVNLDSPTDVVLFDNPADTGITGGLSAHADNLTFNAALGPLGVFITGGTGDLSLNFSYEGSGAADHFVSLAAISGFSPSLTGNAGIVLPVYFPSQSNYVGDISFSAPSISLSGGSLNFTPTLTIDPDILNLDFSHFDLFSNIPLMVDAADQFLSTLQDIMDGQVFGVKLPLIGDKLQDGARFIENLRENFIEPLRTLVSQAPQKTTAIIQQLLFDALSPTHLLLNQAATAEATSPADITIEQDDSHAQWNIMLGQTYAPKANINFDLGFPGLNLKVDSELNLNVHWNLAFGLGISLDDGAYIDVSKAHEASVHLEAGLSDGSSIVGTLGFLQLVGIAHDPTKIQADFNLNLVNSTDSNAPHLSFSELGDLSANLEVDASANVDIGLTAQFDPTLIPATIAAALPKVKAEFLLDWHVSGDPFSNFDIADGLQLVEFKNVQLDLGSFMNDLIMPVVQKIQEITGPLQPIIDIVTARIPVLSDLAGRTITLIDIAAAFGEVDPDMIYAIADIVRLVNSIQSTSMGEFLVPFGDFTIYDANAGGSGSLFGSGDLGNLKDPNFNAHSLGDNTAFDSLLSSTGLAGQLPSLFSGDTFNASSLDAFSGDANTKDTAKKLFGGSFNTDGQDGQKYGFDFPLFKDPGQVFGLLMGRPATIITYDLPPFLLNFQYEQSFEIYGPLFGLVTAGLGLKIDLAFGYDTQGISDFAAGNFSNPLDLLSGLFISDTDHPDGTGTDVPELVLSGTLGVGAELNAGIASAGVTANIIIEANFDLDDPNSDGKVRIAELLNNFLYEFRQNPALAPLAIFDISGDVAFQLSAFIKFLFARFDFNITPKIVLFQFDVPFDREPVLAAERGDGSLLLDVGPNAAARLHGNTTDIGESIFAADAGAGKVKVWAPALGVPEDAAQIYSANKIVAYGGEGNDTIDLSGISIPAEIYGGSGNDTLTGGSGRDHIEGGVGDDIISGNGEADVLIGDEGNDTINGGDGNDIIFGDAGEISQSAEDGSIRSSIGLKDGNDIINAGEGNDIVFGGGGNDQIGGDINPNPASPDGGSGVNNDDYLFGDGGRIEAPSGVPDFSRLSLTDRKGGGNDTIFGNAGVDHIFGGSGDDKLDGGEGDDVINGESGRDTIYGGGGADLIHGGTDDDSIFGFDDLVAGYRLVDGADGGDTIYGDEANDFIRGNRGDDTIYGGAGADTIFGDQNNDHIYGEDGPDLIYGGGNNDYVEGATGNDIVFGDDGLVAFIDFGGPGSHKVIGDGTLAPTDSIITDSDGKQVTLDLILTQVNAATDGDDTVIGGEGDDIVLGGAANDTIYGDLDPNQPLQGPVPAGTDILIGDGGRIEFSNRKLRLTRTVVGTIPAEAGADVISGNGGNDVIFGGGGADTLYGRMDASFSGPTEDSSVTDHDILVGDDGEVDYDAGVLAKIFTNLSATAIATGGADVAYGNVGNDILFGGIASDQLHGDNGGDGPDILFGDNGEIDFTAGQITSLFTTDTTAASGDSDAITGDENGDIILGGVAGDNLSGNDGNDILLGDNGRLLFHPDLSQTDNFLRLDSISSQAPGVLLGFGGDDTISGNKDSDIMLGGAGGDSIYGDALNGPAANDDLGDIALGDNGEVDFSLQAGANLRTQIFTLDTSNATGGIDTIEGNAADDIILGGVQGDLLRGNTGRDILIGDNGRLRFDLDADLNTLDKVETTDLGLGGVDTVSGNENNDVILGAADGDTLYGDANNGPAGAQDGRDIILGDNGYILFTSDPAKTAGTGADQFVAFGATVQKIETTDTVASTGGSDAIQGNASDDILIGGTQGDSIHGNTGNDIILGDNALLDWLYGGDSAFSSIESQLPNWNAPAALFDSNTTTLDLITTETPNLGGRDQIWGDEANDVVFGGTDSDTIYGNGGNDLLFGDHGRVYPQNSALRNAIGFLANFPSHNFFSIDTGNTAGGEGDIIYGNEGDDLLVGGQGDDRLFGGTENDDLVGGHNVPGGIDELSSAAIQATASAGSFNDLLDGGSGNDVAAGDNAVIWRETGTISPRFATVNSGGTIYVPLDPYFAPNATGNQPDPSGAGRRSITLLDHSLTIQNADASSVAGKRYGSDIIAGGPDNDTIFGQLGNDIIQGDGALSSSSTIPAPGAAPFLVSLSDSGGSNSGSFLFDVREAATDADDYIEGNGGADLIYGDLGQDDIIGGSSNLFGLGTGELRPDGADMIHGGAANPTDLARNNAGPVDSNGSTLPGGHTRDADVIMGDNADIFRLVALSGGSSVFLTFNYDAIYAADPSHYSRIIPRAFQLLDYDPFNPGPEIGAGDVVHGETGDDIIHGMSGSDIIYGEGQDDDIYGGLSNDWISGGAGDDAVLGDDGKIFTSRNGLTEPLQGLAVATTQSNISTPGNIQTATINVTGTLKKSVDLEPFDLVSLPNQTAGNQGFDDIIFGGLGNDAIHGGMGDDAISGAEAMIAPIVNGSPLPYFYNSPGNSGNALNFGGDSIGKGYTDAREFGYYDQYHPLQKIQNFFLNFEATNASNQKIDDGADLLFGDTGNDWLAGGTGRDDTFGGWGNDLLDADDNKDTNGGLNNVPDDVNATPSFGDPDRAFGGAGLDVMIGNTGGDRLIDWVGEFNSYVVPFSPFGMGTVSRTVQPQLPEFLYALSASDGADQTRIGAGLGTADRNGEPYGEIALVLQHDAWWQDQTGPPSDPQAGNTPGTQRDTRLVQNFSTTANYFAPAAGQWTLASGRYAAAPVNGGDAVSLIIYNEPQQPYQEILATANMDKSKTGTKSNAYIVFDYQSPTNFKFAGIDCGLSKLRIGQRTDQGWEYAVQSNLLIQPNADYQLKVALEGNKATLVVNGGNSLSYTFANALNGGLLGLGTDNSSTRFDDVQVQVLPPGVVRSVTADFNNGLSDAFTARTGTWDAFTGKYRGTPAPGADSALSILALAMDHNYNLDYSAIVNTSSFAGLVFDQHSATDFKFAAIVPGSNQVVIGHRTANGWYYDSLSSQSLAGGTDYALGISIRGSSVSVLLNGQTKLSFTFSKTLTNGGLGLISKAGPSTFDNVIGQVL